MSLQGYNELHDVNAAKSVDESKLLKASDGIYAHLHILWHGDEPRSPGLSLLPLSTFPDYYLNVARAAASPYPMIRK